MDNTPLFFLIFNLNSQNFFLDQLLIFGAVDLIYLSFGLVLFLGLKGKIKDKKSALLIILSIPVAVLLIKIIHLFYYESRPFVSFNFLPVVTEDNNASFPSRHATISAILTFAFAYYRSKWAFIFLIFMIWISLGRIFAGVHYPLDVLGGFVTAVIALIISLMIKNILKKFLLL